MIPGYFSFLSAHDIPKRTAWTLFFCLTTRVRCHCNYTIAGPLRPVPAMTHAPQPLQFPEHGTINIPEASAHLSASIHARRISWARRST